MKVGLSEIILPTLPLPQFFRQASEADYETVELCIGGKCPLQLDNWQTCVPEINELSAQYHLPVSSVVHWQCMGNLLASGDEQKISIEQTCRGLEIGQKLGAKSSLHTLGYITEDLYYDEAYENAVFALKEIAKTAEKTGVSLAVEFVWNGFLFSPLEMKRFLEDVGSSSVGFYFDPGNMAVFQHPHHWARILGKHIKMVHMKDWKGNALNGTWPALLQGSIPFHKVMQELRNAGYCGPLINEVDPAAASLRESSASIRKIMKI